MASLKLQLKPEDYSRAFAYVLRHMRRAGQTSTSLGPWSILATVLYTIPLLVIVVAPNYQDDHTRLLLRGAVVALLLVPLVFVLGVVRLRKADAKALQPLEPSPSELVTVEATAEHLTIKTDTMNAQFPWSAASVFALDEEFAVVLVPRFSPLPVTRAGSPSPEEFYLFVRHAQQYKAASAA